MVHLKNMVENQKGQVDVKDIEEILNSDLVGRRETIAIHEVITFKDLNFICVIGRGAFGKVFLAKVKNGDKLYAVKSIRKDVLIQTDQVASTVLEKDIMLDCDHPFIVGMDYLF